MKHSACIHEHECLSLHILESGAGYTVDQEKESEEFCGFVSDLCIQVYFGMLDALLASEELPEEYRDRFQVNRLFCICSFLLPLNL